MKCILDLLHKDIDNDFYKEKRELYDSNDKGFYVHAPKSSQDFKKSDKLVKYILRYTGRPAMAQSRILDVNNDFIKYFI